MDDVRRLAIYHNIINNIQNVKYKSRMNIHSPAWYSRVPLYVDFVCDHSRCHIQQLPETLRHTNAHFKLETGMPYTNVMVSSSETID